MTRILRRPMFRLGGNTDQGIMSGVAPRQGYGYGERVGENTKERAAILRKAVGQTPDTSLSQFMIDFGLDIASRPPQGSIFSTAAAAAKEPYQGYKASKAARSAFDQKIGLAAAESAMSHEDKMLQIAMDNMSEKDLSSIAKLAQEAVENGEYKDYNTAWRAIFRAKVMESKAYTKPPEVLRREAIEERALDIRTRIDEDISVDVANEISTIVQRILDGEFDDPDTEDKKDQLSKRFDANQYYIESDDIGARQENVGGDSTIKLQNPDNITGNYIHDSVYYNPQDQKLYRYNSKGYFIEYVVDNFGG